MNKTLLPVGFYGFFLRIIEEEGRDSFNFMALRKYVLNSGEITLWFEVHYETAILDHHTIQ